jgi:hypothetical protein
MPLTTINLTPEELASATQQLQEVLHPDSFTAKSLALGLEGMLSPMVDHALALPHPIYVLSLAQARTEPWELSQPARIGIVHLEGDTPRTLAEFVKEEGNLRFAGLQLESAGAQALTAGIGASFEDKAVQGGDFELRVLRIPALYVTALWLHGATDWALPLPPSPKSLSRHELMPLADFAELVRKLIADRPEKPQVEGNPQAP